MNPRRKIVTIVMTLIFLAVFFSVRRMVYNDAVDPKYHAALYYAHIRAIDDQTSEPINVEIEWDYELISPYVKGSGASVIETHADKSVTVALVGKRLERDLRIGIAADGYRSEGVDLDADRSGILETESSRIITEVRLRRTSQKDTTPNNK
jgi:hypothetical protein